jgi:N-acetylneuraminate synthase
LARAKKLIRLCAAAGANAAKFQHFKAETIVNKEQFDKKKKTAHQIKWKTSVYEVYKKASINNQWNNELQKECKKCKIDFLTSPYDLSYVDIVNKFIPAYKIGSGDITWKEILIKIAKKNKPVLLATGASTLKDIIFACKLILKINKKLIVMQCNTNYTAVEKNIELITIRINRPCNSNNYLNLISETELDSTDFDHFIINNFKSKKEFENYCSNFILNTIL